MNGGIHEGMAVLICKGKRQTIKMLISKMLMVDVIIIQKRTNYHYSHLPSMDRRVNFNKHIHTHVYKYNHIID